jgi:hypothetical protein
MITPDLLIHFVVVLIYILFWAVAFIVFYHLTRFGIGIHPKRLAAIFFLGSISLFLMSVITFSKIDFSFLSNFV